MKKSLKLLLVFISITLVLGIIIFCYLKNSTIYFRNIRLGMTKEDVSNIEAKKNNCTQISSVYNTYITYNAKFENYVGTAVYGFDESGKVNNICYTVDSTLENDYENIKEVFKSEKYTVLKDDEVYIDGTIRTNLKKGNTKMTISYDSINNKVVIYIQKYKESNHEK